jgi:hypothetical protein
LLVSHGTSLLQHTSICIEDISGSKRDRILNRCSVCDTQTLKLETAFKTYDQAYDEYCDEPMQMQTNIHKCCSKPFWQLNDHTIAFESSRVE